MFFIRRVLLQHLECFAGSSGCNLGSIMGEAGRVDGALVGVDHQAGETLHRALIPEQLNKSSLLLSMIVL